MRNINTATDALLHRLEKANLFAQAWDNVRFNTRAPYKEVSTQCMFRNKEGHWNLVVEIIDAPKNMESKDTIFNIDILGFEKIPELIEDRATYWKNHAKEIEETLSNLETTLYRCDDILNEIIGMLNETNNGETRCLIREYMEEKIMNLV